MVVMNANIFIDVLSFPAVAARRAFSLLSVWATKLYSCS